MSGFAENTFVARRLQIGSKAVIAVTDRDPRCKMITLDPNTMHASPEILRTVRDNHEGKAGLYVLCSWKGLFDREMRSGFWINNHIAIVGCINRQIGRT